MSSPFYSQHQKLNHSFRNMCFSLRLCSMLEDKLGVDLPKQGFGLPMRWRRRSKKSKYFGAPLTDHDGNLSAFNGTRQWREYLATILRVVLLVVGFWKHSRNILKIFYKYPRNIENLSEKMPRVVLFVLRRAVPRRNIKGSLAGRPHSFTFQHQY